MKLTFQCRCGDETKISYALFAEMKPDIKCGCGRWIVRDGVVNPTELPDQSQAYGNDCPGGQCDF